MDSPAFMTIAIIAIAIQSLMLFLALFEPALRYKISRPPKDPLDSGKFLQVLSTIAGTSVFENTKIAEVCFKA